MKISRTSLIAFLITGWAIVPIYLITISTLGGTGAVFEWPKSIVPLHVDPSSILAFFQVQGIWESAINSILAATMTMAITMVFGLPAGYALARYSFRGKPAYRMVLVLTRAFPIAVLALPLAAIFSAIGLYDTLFAVAIVHSGLALPFSVLVTASLFVGVPRELEEAAWTLGCTKVSAFRKIVLPIALPGITATAIFSFLISWNEVFASSILTTRNRTLTAYLLSQLDQAPMEFKFAGGFFLIVPAVLFIFVIRRHLFSMWGVANR